MKILIDNGHGQETAGKRSPDGKLQEWKYTREIAQRVVTALRVRGYDAELLTPEPADITLGERVRRVNRWCKKYGSTQVLLVSIHLNAAGNGSQWSRATGWEAYTSPGDTAADRLATCLYRAAENLAPSDHKLRLRTDWSDGDPDKESKFYILMKTPCPAVLTENFFMDSTADYDYLLSTRGQDDIVGLHVKGIMEFVEGE